MIKRVLIANRGEIAVQTIRALHEMNLQAVAVYSTADRDGLFVQMADQSVCIGSGLPQDSYLNMGAILDAAVLTGSDAIFPGYGFLAENSEFAELCQDYGVKFIGPSAEVINLMGNKSNAKETMKKLDVPTIPGSDGFVDSLADAKRIAAEIGYPVMLKAAAGGGGKGIRQVNNQAELAQAYSDTKRESQLSYGDDRLYLEKDLSDAKHIEMQAIADQHGHVVYFPERDCSLQRNHQKILEESPCLELSEAERAHMGEVVVRAMRGIHYENTGTFEFLMDHEHHFYFMEMNTRLQVEHTITEEVADVELIKAMIMVANGDDLPFRQSDCGVHGYALECRINAEDPAQDFQPCAGKITKLHFPVGTKGVRIDSGVEVDSLISPFYDSMIAKIIVHMPTKPAAVAKMIRVLHEFEIEGVKTNREFLLAVLQDQHFQTGDFNNLYIENVFLKDWMKQDGAK
ncbi:acetyl-CoA carboxylase biotin carboxylase subunit [Fructilactobacillus cliffordii]|uniref:acetyl-CoA carboxylase biotin carboxylase subunit n=1 Tax=Fructilactobacillus cliffordii TaxID=2940299 RepID=UPI0020932BFC|nr:acetyl-CoA carboxylase biotin carboxylase subunit [Fructilactobacillus cliffordii]USS87144.1 acetyl-CoA carboxylase biotin carboxylase subunit [Fructilactobacillus cliffordii]